MKNLTLKKIAEVTGGRLIYPGLDDGTEITAVVSDSRKVVEGCLFLCIPGEKVDGASFARAAVDAGAKAVMAQRKLEGLDAPYILVESVLDATQELAGYYREALGVKVVGITGSVGKTSTKEFIASVLSEKYKVSKTQGNLNNQWGVPFTIFSLDENVDVAVVEMGISDFGEMDRLSYIAQPDVVVMTNIGQCHLEFLKTRDGILKAKSEIFNHMNPKGHVIVNGDDDKLGTIRQVNGKRPEYFGLNKHCDIYADRIRETGLEGSEFTAVIRDRGGRMQLNVSIPYGGKHMIYNALAAAQVGLDMGVALMDIKKGLGKVQAVSGRNNIIRTEKFTIIDDCYNASPASMMSSIDLLCKADTRKVAILGDMLELGSESDRYHSQIGQYVGRTAAELIVCIGENSVRTFGGAKMMSDNKVEYFHTLDEAMEMLPDLLIPGDTILLKASNSMNFGKLLEFIQKL